MTSQLNTDLLNDTLNVVQLARQAAMARGNQDRAGKFSSVANELHKVVSENGQVKGENDAGLLDLGAALRPDGSLPFHSLLSAVQNEYTPEQVQSAPSGTQIPPVESSSIQERNLLVTAMAAGTMSEVDIARQLGITRDEVRAILSLNKINHSPHASSSGGES